MNLPSDLFVVDVETTGEDPFVHDILSVAFVPVFGLWDPLVVHVQQPKSAWTEFALENFGRSTAAWATAAVPPSSAAVAISSYFQQCVPGKKATLVGHNVGFDLSFLRKLYFQSRSSANLDWLSHRAVDTHSLLYACWLIGEISDSALSSDGAFSAFGIGIDDTERHTAIGDAIATKELFLRVINLLHSRAHQAPAEPRRAAR